MARLRCGVALVGALAVVLAGCGGSSGTKFLNLGTAQREILRLTQNVYGSEATVGAVRCPREVPIKVNLDFFCTVDIDGVPLRVNLRQTDDQGNVHIDQGQAVIFTKKLADFVASYATEHGTPTSQVSCGEGPVLVRTPGKTVSCTVVFADGRSGTATALVNDNTGKVGLTSLEPSKS